VATTNVAHGVGRRRCRGGRASSEAGGFCTLIESGAELGRGRGYDSWCRVKWMLRAAVALIFVLLLVVSASAQVTVKGDAAAWREISAAHGNLAKLKTYRMKIAATGQPEAIVMEKVNPDRTRMIIQAQGVSMETIVVGNETRTRMSGTGMPAGSPAGWQCQPAQAQAGPRGSAPDPTKAKGEVTVSRLADATIDGAKTRGYQYTMKSDGPPVQSRVFVLVDRSLPRRTEVLDNSGNVESTFDYYDFNAPITIDLPKCG